jgi:hypothetical protein
MGKTILFGLIWFVAFSAIILAVIGGAIGYSVGSQYPDNSAACYDAIRVAARQAGVKYRPLILTGAALLSAMGSVAGILPGTKRQSA